MELGIAIASAVIFFGLWILERNRANRYEKMVLRGPSDEGPSLPVLAKQALKGVFEKDILGFPKKQENPELLKKIADQKKAMADAGRHDLLS